jgi:hypothetical protein
MLPKHHSLTTRPTAGGIVTGNPQMRGGPGRLVYVCVAHPGIVRTVRTLLAFSHGSGMVQGFEWGFEGSRYFRTT